MANPNLYQMNPAPVARHGSAWHWETQWLDTATGLPFNFTLHPELTLSSSIVGHFGHVYATLNNRGTGNGTISGDGFGILSWDLPQAVVDTLPLTRPFQGGGDVRVATWRSRGLLVFDFVVNDGVHDPWTFFDGQLVVSAAIS